MSGWLNVDVVDSEFDIDLASTPLPWRDQAFSAAVGQHVVEHLDLESELLPFLEELHRVLDEEGELWLSCPDMAKVLRSYVDHDMEDLIWDRRSRYPYDLNGLPNSQMVNDLFHQGGEHKNLFDFELLSAVLEQVGFRNPRRVQESALLDRFPEFPPRNDDAQTLYVAAGRP